MSWEQKIGFPIISVVIAAVCAVYLINPTAGVLELLPDNLPFVGNLDEAAAVAGLIQALAHIGFIEYAGQRMRLHSWQDVRSKWRRRGPAAPGAKAS